MAAPKRTSKQRLYDLEEISGLYLKGWTQVRIADYLAKLRPYKLDQSTISRDLSSIRKAWLESSVRNFDEAKAQELAKIDNLEMIYFQEWMASREPIVRRKTAKKINDKSRSDSGKDPDWRTVEATQEVSLGTGDPRFLQGVQWCIDRRCKLLGLDAPTKSEIQQQTVNLSDLTDSQLQRLAAGEEMVSILAEK